ncbi:hypothetical protein [Streptomyces sp. NPDC017890]|uniref:hypothetical protein n=1 Tax=Streptomyces sp. NPDC017890 TaxID=3365015 RepID=UPI0037B9DA97
MATGNSVPWVHFRCRGSGQGNKRFLDGHIGTGRISLVDQTGFLGTRWDLHPGGGEGVLRVRCVGPGQGGFSLGWLDGNTVTGAVSLVKANEAPSGTRWLITRSHDGLLVLTCNGSQAGSFVGGRLDGNTETGQVRLVTDEGLSGTKWGLEIPIPGTVG